MAIYNAGNAYLQILPSFRGIERLMQRETAKLARSIDQSVARSASSSLLEAFQSIDPDKVARAGRETGDKWANQFERQITSRFKGLTDHLGEISPKADLSDFDRAIAQTRKEITELGKTKFSPDSSSNLTAVSQRLDEIADKMNALNNNTDDPVHFGGLNDAIRQTHQIADMLDQISQRGGDDGRTYGGKFATEARQTIEKVLHDIPEVQVGASTTEADNRIADLRERLVRLGDQKIGIDIDRQTFVRSLADIRTELESLARRPQSIALKFDLDTAVDDLRKFHDKVEPILNQQLAEIGRNNGITWAGAYADAVQQRVARAAQSIPNIPFNLDDSEAQQKLAGIRLQLDSLGNKRVGVDISVAETEAKIAALHQQLEELDNDDVTIDVRTNAAAAAAQLALITQEADNADDAMGSFAQNAGITMSRLGYLIAIGASLGSLVAPAAAAAAVAVAGIGTSALAAVSGLGVFTLSLYGIGDAVKKIAAYQQDANQSAKSFSQSQERMADAADAVQVAERNLQYTREDAADAAVESQQRIADAQANVGKVQRDVAESIKKSRENEKEAVQDVARARSDAADSIKRAVEAEDDAERSATKAIKEQKQARQELSEAIKDAVQDLKELQTAVKRNQLDIDEATTAAMKAKQELDKIMSNPRATEIERRAALEAYQDKILQIEELKNKQTELAKQQAAADKDGVESTNRVKKAREQVANADERAADAARRLENARTAADKARVDAADRIAAAEKQVADAHAATAKAQTDGAERIADAQRQVADAQKAAAKQQEQAQRQILAGTEAVTKAQRNLGLASVAAGVAGGDALDSMNDALNNLSPAGQAFAKWLFSLKPYLDDLRQSSQEGVLPGLQDAIQTLVDEYFPAFNDFVKKIAAGLGNIFRATAQVLLTPQWREFFSFVSGQALPNLQGLWVMSLNVARGVANLVKALNPLAKPMGEGLIDLTERFARWSDTLDNSTGFQKFLDYAQRVGPKVATLIENLVEFIGRLVIAAAPMGEFLLDLVTNVFEFVNSWDVGALGAVVDVVAVLGGSIWALTGFVRGIKFVTELWNAITLITARGQAILSAAVVRFNTATAGATTATGLLNGRLFVTAGAGTAAAAGMGAAQAAAGPLGIALLAIGGIWLLSSQRANKAEQDTDELTGALQLLGDEYRKAANAAQLGSAAVADSFKKIVAQNEDLQKAVVNLTNIGLSVDQIAGAASGNAAELDAVLSRINHQIAQLIGQGQNARLSHEQLQANLDQIDSLEALRDKLQEAADKAHLSNDAMAILSKSTRDATTSSRLLTPSQQALADAQQVLADETATAQEKLDALTKAQDTMRQSTIDAIEADESFNSGIITLKQSVEAAKKAKDDDARSLSVHTANGLRNRDMIESLVQSADKMYDADVALNGVTVDAIKKGQDHYAQIRNVAKQLGLNKTETDKLITAYGKIPKSIDTAVTMDPNSFQTVYKNLQRMQFMQSMLKAGKDASKADEAWQEYQRELSRATSKATGGRIVGPGTGTSDDVLMWGSNGEWVQQASAVNYYGDGFMRAINEKRIPKQMLPGFAGGGRIRVPFQVDVSKTWVPNASWVQQNTPGLVGDGSFKGISADASVAKLQKFALAQRGKRYLWAAVGPDFYDCSGLVGNLWALATGHSLYHRYMSTADMGPGRHGMIAGPGKNMTVYLGPGHTAANVGGLHVEAYGGNGTPLAIGRIGTRLSYYTQKLHLPGFAQGGMVGAGQLQSPTDRMVSFLRYGWPEPPRGSQYANLLKSRLVGGVYDAGGMLPPGLSTIYNGTGRPEPVLTGQQWETIAALARTAAAQGGNVYQFEFRDTTLDASKLRALQEREAIMSRDGRAR